MSRAAIRYAKAVLDLSTQKGSSKETFIEMKDALNTLQGSKELQLMLKSPVVKQEDKRAVLKEVFSNSSEILLSLMDILIDNKRGGLLEKVATNYISLYNTSINAVEAVVTSAIPLDNALEQKVLAKVKELTGATEVTLVNKVDPAIIGGFVLRVGDTQYDASIANNFEELRKEFKQAYN
ncbi:ATP synthase F1 subunit delta [uncultured Planktosalinus sp.]|uniref:ATP synthase F1 subunit delta n=1 Tax=uncultured Planktosalinus sp. TaxID=1810935 RepID=UPI0030D907BD